MAVNAYREFCVNPGFCETQAEWGETACAQCETARGQAAERTAFEQWVKGAPYERDVTRWPENEARHAWPGKYRDYLVDLAWEAWQARAERAASGQSGGK